MVAGPETSPQTGDETKDMTYFKTLTPSRYHLSGFGLKKIKELNNREIHYFQTQYWKMQ
jgi:hypothetical protein